jgi:hypothetical protein
VGRVSETPARGYIPEVSDFRHRLNHGISVLQQSVASEEFFAERDALLNRTEDEYAALLARAEAAEQRAQVAERALGHIERRGDVANAKRYHALKMLLTKVGTIGIYQNAPDEVEITEAPGEHNEATNAKGPTLSAAVDQLIEQQKPKEATT